MALAKIQEVAEGYFGSVGSALVWRVFDVTGPASYTVGGDVLAATDLKMAKVLAVLPSQSSGYSAEYDYVASKLKVLRPTTINHAHTENTAGAYTQNATTGNPTTLPAANQTELTAASGAANGIVFRIFVIGFAP